MIVTPFLDRKARWAGLYEGIALRFDRNAPMPAIGVPIPVMICLAAVPRYVDGYAAMSPEEQAAHPPSVPFLVVRAITPDDHLITVSGFTRSAPFQRPRAFLSQEAHATIMGLAGHAPRFLAPGRSPVIEVALDAAGVHRSRVFVCGADLRTGLARVTGLPDLDAMDPEVAAILARSAEETMPAAAIPRRTVDTLTSRRGQRSA